MTSDNPRVGKTTYILDRREKDEEIIRIVLGDIDQKYLMDKMNQFELKDPNEEKFLIHIQLYENQNDKTNNLIRNFLF